MHTSGSTTEPTHPDAQQRARAASSGAVRDTRAGAKLRNEELLITKFGGVNLRLALDSALSGKWAAEGALGLRQLWAWFAQYPYLPRLRDISVTVEADHKGTDGFADNTVRTISENAKTLRFKDFGWEKE